MTINSFAGSAIPLSPSGLDDAAALLGARTADLWTVLNVETAGCGFLRDRRPAILFERHIFHLRTGGVHDAAHPDLSSPHPGGYLGGTREYERLNAAVALDATAALESTSWGIGQIMGFNFRLSGYASAAAMVEALMEREDAHVEAMARFLQSSGLAPALVEHRWPAFARGYNGPSYAKNQYDARLAAAYARFTAGPLPDLTVRCAQMLLMFLGHDVGAIDGILGKRTRSAIGRFCEERGIAGVEEPNEAVLEAMRQAVSRLQPLPAHS
jgi:hypothetical protein